MAPDVAPHGSLQSILFYGCSYTFGAGVGDRETLLYRIGAKLVDRYRAQWGRFAPRYVLGTDGGVRREGRFIDGDRSATGSLANQFLKSGIVRAAVDRLRAPTEKELELCVRLIHCSRTLIERRYRGCRFVVVFWDSEYLLDRPGYVRVCREFIKRLRDLGMPVYLVSDILPNSHDQGRHAIHAVDRHPNAAAYALISEFLERVIAGG